MFVYARVRNWFPSVYTPYCVERETAHTSLHATMWGCLFKRRGNRGGREDTSPDFRVGTAVQIVSSGCRHFGLFLRYLHRTGAWLTRRNASNCSTCVTFGRSLYREVP